MHSGFENGKIKANQWCKHFKTGFNGCIKYEQTSHNRCFCEFCALLRHASLFSDKRYAFVLQWSVLKDTDQQFNQEVSYCKMEQLGPHFNFT